MAYNPGVYDRSGEILAQGIIQSTRQLEMRREALKKREEENKQLQSQAKALETLLPVYARNAGVTPEEIDQFLQSSPDESPRARAARLSSAIEGIVGNAALKSKAVQDQELQARIQTQRMQQQAIQRGQQEVDDLNTHIDRILGQSRTNGVLTPEMQQEVDRMSSSPIADLRRSGVRVTPEMIAEITRTQIQSAPRGAPKPMPGSGGFRTINVPGVGDIVLDAATGEPVESGKIIRPAPKPDPKPTEAQVSFETNVDVALKKLQTLRKTVEQDGTWESSYLGNAQSAANLLQIPNQLATTIAKIVDPSSVAREGEVKTMEKLIPLGMFASKDVAIKSIDNMIQTLSDYQKARGSAQDGSAPAKKADGPGIAGANHADSAQSAVTYRHTDGKDYPIRTIRGVRGVVIGAKFYPITQ